MPRSATVQDAYQRVLIATSDSRSIEAEAFARVNGELSRTQENMASDYPAYVKAVSRNLQLWTLIASDVAGEGNQLPKELRVQIWGIAGFVRRQSMNILSSRPPINANALIEINANMIAGLKKQVSSGSSS